MLTRLFVFTISLFVAADVLARDIYVPPALDEWRSWVLDGHDHLACPLVYHRAQHHCVWVSSTTLAADGGGLSFSLDARLFAPRWLALPGEDKHWPVDVSMLVKGKRIAMPVRSREGRPQVYLDSGEYTLGGRINWQRVPTSIALPANSGLIDLSLDGAKVSRPEIDDAGRLWLRQRRAADVEHAENTENIQVFRLLRDDNPAQLVTRMVLDISGEAREILTGQFLLDNFVPLSLHSELPARIEENNNVRVQVKPGRWRIELRARYQGVLSSLSYQKRSPIWPDAEIWAVQPNRSLRSVQVRGADAIDPSQTNMPEEWRGFPAYRLQSQQALWLDETRRGDPTPEADDLRLQRDLFLDFDGAAFTVADKLSGQVKRSWRLDVQPNVALGSAVLNGTPQLITQSRDGLTRGIELRQGSIGLNAVSRLERPGVLPASGWRHDVERLGATLHLPPGWSLLASSGADSAAFSWLARWSLWDIFLLLIIVVAMYRLCGPGAAAIAFFSLLLIYHRAGAPLFIWLNLVAVLALLGVTTGRLKRWLSFYQLFSFILLAFILLPFAVDQVRQAVYPQLKHQTGGFAFDGGFMAEAPLPEQADLARPEAAPAVEAQAATADAPGRVRESVGKLHKKRGYALESRSPGVSTEHDPNAMIQTGPGVPTWTWDRIALSWNGPVAQSEMLRLYLVPPWLNRLGHLLAVLMSLLLAWVLFSRSKDIAAVNMPELKAAAATASLPCVFLLGAAQPAVVDAAVEIDSAILDELQKRLLRAAQCLPQCAAVEQAGLRAQNNRLTVNMVVDAQDAVAVGLPAWRSGWLPQNVTVAGKPAVLRFGAVGQLFVFLPRGRHRIVLDGAINSEVIELRFGMPIHNFSALHEGWDLSGARDGFVATGTVQLRRLQRDNVAQDDLLPDPVPPFVTVSRQLNLGLEWRMVTTVTRVAPAQGAITLAVPLLSGEAPMTELARRENAVVVVFAPDQHTVSWQSLIEQRDKVNVVAPQHHRWAELWSLQASPVWHLDFAGIAPIKQEGGDLHAPVWMPWPGESLEVSVARPQAVAGDSLTLDAASLRHNVGQRANKTHLDLRIRSSRGGNYPLVLPADATLESLRVDGVPQALVRTAGKIEIPLRPGSQQVQLSWRGDRGVQWRSSIPRLDLGDNATNLTLQMELPRDRWPLFVGGPPLGPAVLLWGVFLVVALASALLAKSDLTPLRFHHWLLLGLGVASTNIYTPLLIVAWLFCLGLRGRFNGAVTPAYFKLMQSALLMLTLVALVSLLAAIPMGLLAKPDMHIVGNGSHAYFFQWYQDRIAGPSPSAWVVSAPLLYYRLVMLAWSLWLALALLDWLKWGWSQLSRNGLWRRQDAVVQGSENG